MSESYKKRDSEEVFEEQTLVRDSNGPRIVAKGDESARLSPGWKRTNKSDDESNFKDGPLDQVDLELNPPNDRLKFLYLIMALHGIGVLMPWNMFINSFSYFELKLITTPYATDYPFYFTLACQAPNLFFTWCNVFIQMGGNSSVRIAWGLVVQAVVFVFTIAMVMIDTKDISILFFWVTIGTIIILNTANGIYQNSVYGMAAKLPGKYTGAIILGSNLCGTLTTITKMLTKEFSPNPYTAATYYFIAALFVILACFDTYFSLPLNRFYRYNELLNAKQQKKADGATKTERIPYGTIIKQCWVQLLNVYLLFFVTLTIFPAIQMNIKNDKSFINKDNYADYMCFLCFNLTALLGSLLATKIQWPNPKYLMVPIALRILYIPAFIFLCNYEPEHTKRVFGETYHNDWLYLALSLTMGLSSGYFSSLAMVNCSKVVESRFASIAGMLAGAALSSGIFSGILFGMAIQNIMFVSTKNP